MNPLNDYPAVRLWLYRVQWAVNGVAAILGAYFAVTQTAPADLPQWYVVGLAVLPVLWTYLGITAAANTPTVPPPAEAD